MVPLFHVNGWGTPHFLTMVGGRHVMLRKFEPLALIQAVERHKVTRILAVPAIFNAVLHHSELAEARPVEPAARRSSAARLRPPP